MYLNDIAIGDIITTESDIFRNRRREQDRLLTDNTDLFS